MYKTTTTLKKSTMSLPYELEISLLGIYNTHKQIKLIDTGNSVVVTGGEGKKELIRSWEIFNLTKEKHLVTCQDCIAGKE